MTADIPLTGAARRALARGQRLATQRSAPSVMPAHLLLALIEDPGSAVPRAIQAMGADPEAIAEPLKATAPGDQAARPVLFSPAVRYALNNSLKEAQLLGHQQVDPVHMLLGLLYRDTEGTAALLEAAGVRFYDLRQYLQDPARGRETAVLRRPPLPSIRRVVRVSPVIALPLAGLLVPGAALFVGAPQALTVPLTILFVVGGWVTSVCVHEFAHALVAYLGGDDGVVRAGYLTFDPLRYTHPLLSIGLPLIFIFLGGIGLPGGAVYINTRALRGPGWQSWSSAAGPLGTLAFTLLIGWPFLFDLRSAAGDERFWSALAFLVFLEVTAVLLNLLPIPPLDGFGVVAPWLPGELRDLAQRVGFFGLLIVFFLLFQGGPLGQGFFAAAYGVVDALRIPQWLVDMGHQQMRPF